MAGIKDLKPKKGGQYKQGYYEPIYPQKYKTNCSYQAEDKV